MNYLKIYRYMYSIMFIYLYLIRLLKLIVQMLILWHIAYHNSLLILYKDNMKKRPLKGILESLLRCVASAASYCPRQQVLAHKLPAYLIADQLSPLPDTLQSLINHISPLLMFPHRSVQIAAFHILRRYSNFLLAVLYQNAITNMEYTYHHFGSCFFFK